jgi:hypothetical protein
MYEPNGRIDVLYVRFHRARSASVSLPVAIRADSAALFLLVSIFWGIVLYLALVQVG